jgi:glycosyltransferase involved in cell wall biosynthesis
MAAQGDRDDTPDTSSQRCVEAAWDEGPNSRTQTVKKRGHSARAYRGLPAGEYCRPLVPTSRRPYLLVLNQYYWPGVEATAHLLGELCNALAESYDVTVITGRLLGHEQDPDYEVRDGVEIIRVHSTAYDRAPLLRRAINYFTYLARALRRGLTGARRPDVVLCMTDPPMVGDVALAVARRYRAPLIVVSQDVFPEIAVELGRLRNPFIVGLLGMLTRFYLRRADRVVAIGETMQRRLEAKGVAPKRLRVIPNWADTVEIVPRPRDNAWARRHLLADRFVVMHSGNIGHAQDLETLIRATTSLRDLEQLAVLLIGFGARHAEYVKLVDEIGSTQVRFVDYQDREHLPLSLASADLHFVGLARGLSGYVVPSRLYGILAAGRPVLAAADEDSETSQLVRRVGCGIVVPPGRPELVAEEIRKAANGEYDLQKMGRLARDYVETQASREHAVAQYRRLLDDVLREREEPRRRRR